MEQAIISLLTLIFFSLGLVIFLLLRRKTGQNDNSLVLLQQLNHISQVLDSKLSESNKSVQFQFSQSAKIISDVMEKLAKLDETNRQVVSFAGQLQNLQDILKNPKQRGLVGEYLLETVLKNVLPPSSYQMQYPFHDGTIVDAVVFVDKRIIPIDAKFSLENYNRLCEAKDPSEKKRYENIFIQDLKNRIEETAKYVKPEEKTMDFAFMFIPHEAVYYDLLVNKVGAVQEDTNNLIYHAGKKKVIVVSPTSFLAYLQTVLQGLRNQKISEQAHQIIRDVEKLGKHIFVYSDHMAKLGDHLSTTVSSYNKAGKELSKIDKDVVKIAGVERSVNIKEIDGPLEK
jgi:DNA recombination protein RmuC